MVGGSGFYLKSFFEPVVAEVDVPKAIRAEVRALERCLASGETLLALQERFRNLPGPFDAYRKRTCLLERDPAELEQRIRTRTAAMLEAGLVEETEALVARGLRGTPTASRAVGYREVLSMLDGHLPRDELSEAISRSTIQLASRPRKWFRNQFPADFRRVMARKGEDYSVEDFPWAPET